MYHLPWSPTELEAWRAFEEGDLPRSMLRTRWPIGSTWSRTPRSNVRWAPPVEVWEKTDKYMLRVELPGVKKEDIEIVTTKDMITISGVREPAPEVKDEEYQLCEVCYGPFSRSVKFPVSLDPDEVDASYEDGILMVEVKKAKAEVPRKIPIKTK